VTEPGPRRRGPARPRPDFLRADWLVFVICVLACAGLAVWGLWAALGAWLGG
jgi:hypothetical protein